MVAELAAGVVVILAAAAEILHARRVSRVAPLAFGPLRRAEWWTYAVAPLRVAALGTICWGSIALLQIPSKVHHSTPPENSEPKHLIVLLDVSPSMYLKDAGPNKQALRKDRAGEILFSFLERAPVELYKISVLAFYTEAKPVVVDTTDLEVVRNILFGLPMSYAFKAGETDLFSALEEAAKLAKPWQSGSTTLFIISDGDTVASTGMPKMPPSVAHTLVVGIGDARTGTFIDGHQSRQDVSTLRQVAARLGGKYHNGNEVHLSTSLVQEMTEVHSMSVFERLTKREYALLACFLSALALTIMPIALHYFGTSWRPGVTRKNLEDVADV